MGEAEPMDRQVLKAKLYVPRCRSNAVSPPRLHESLDEGARRELTLSPVSYTHLTLPTTPYV